MAYGFAAFNDDSKFIIADNFTNLHFLGKPSLVSGPLPNNAQEIMDANFDSGNIPSSNGCTSIPSSPFWDTGDRGTVDSFNNPIHNRVFDGNTNTHSSGYNWPYLVGNLEWIWVDTQCAQQMASVTVYIHNRGSVGTCKVYYADTQQPSFGPLGVPLTTMAFDTEVSITSANATSGSFTTGWTKNIPLNTNTPHRYWAFVFNYVHSGYGTTQNIKEISLNFNSNPSGLNPTITHLNKLNPRTLFKYTIESSESPLVFLKPQDVNRWHAVIDQQNTTGNTWLFNVLVSGLNNIAAPELYCFTPAAAIAASSETHGMIVKTATNTAFDSRLRPLVLIDGGSLTPPALPANGGTSFNKAYVPSESHITSTVNIGATTININSTSNLPTSGSAVIHGYNHDGAVKDRINNPEIVRNTISWTGKTSTTLTGVSGVSSRFVYDYNAAFGTNYSNTIVRDIAYITPPDSEINSPIFDFKSHNAATYTSSTLATSVARSNLMFAAPSLSQSVQTKWVQLYYNYVYTYSSQTILYQSQMYTNILWWVMYRNAFRLGATTFDSGWNAWQSGLLYSESAIGSSWLGGGQLNTSVGDAPYADKTINLQANTFLIADASKY